MATRRPRPHQGNFRCSVRVRKLGKRLTAERCADCKKKLYHPGPKEWRAVGSTVAIRCLDCRHAFCPACAKKHFAPVQAGRAKLMNAFANAAIRAMNNTSCPLGLTHGEPNAKTRAAMRELERKR